MAGFLEGIGAALTTGSSLLEQAGQNRRQKQLDKDRRDMEVARMALERQRFDLDATAAKSAEGDRLENRADRALTRLGPDGTADDNTAATIEAGGLGGFLAPRINGTISSKQFAPDAFGDGGIMQQESPGLSAGRAVIPNAAQRQQLDDMSAKKTMNESQRRAQLAVSQDKFWVQPKERRAAIWGQTGYGGQLPETVREMQDMEVFKTDQNIRQARAAAAAQASQFDPRRTRYVTRTTPDGQQSIVAINDSREQMPGDVPYQAPTKAKGGAGGGVDSGAYGTERVTRMRDAIREIRGDSVDPKTGVVTPGNRIGMGNTGVGGVLQYLPMTDARKMSGDIRSLLSNVGFNELAEMRAASKTGGALGAISDFENKQLQGVLGTLDQLQHPDDVKRALARIELSLDRWEAEKKKHPEESARLGFAGQAQLGGNPVAMPAPASNGLDCTQRNAQTGKIECR